MEIMVYFNGGDKARFDSDKVVFTRGEGNPLQHMQKGKTEINWDNVCFIREIEKREADDDAM